MRSALLALGIVAALAAIAPSVQDIPSTYAGPDCNANNTIDPQEDRFLELINDYRADNGLNPLVMSDTLNQAAAWKSRHMATHDYFSHEDEGTNRDFVQRLRDCGYTANTWLAENIAAGNDTAAETFAQWRSSPGHNANMLNPDLVAIGIARAFNDGSEFNWYWTTDFGGVADGYTPPPPPSLPDKTGDVDCTGETNSIDAALVLQYTAGMIQTLPCPIEADMNASGATDAIDATIILQIAAGLVG